MKATKTNTLTDAREDKTQSTNYVDSFSVKIEGKKQVKQEIQVKYFDADTFTSLAIKTIYNVATKREHRLYNLIIKALKYKNVVIF